MSSPTFVARFKIPAAITTALLVAVFTLTESIPQDPNYHNFADQRQMLGIANFHNVMSNLPFLVFGLMGMWLVLRNPRSATTETKSAWVVFFFGITLTAFGSGYFHLLPNNDTLFWDRVPMTIGFMSLVAIIVAEYFSPLSGRKLLTPLLLLGVASVAYWSYTESLGSGDLRPYAIVQFVPMLLIPVVIFRFHERSDLSAYLWWMIALYVAAKFAEHFDAQVFAGGEWVSGHAIKHLLASLAPAALLVGLTRRLRHD